MSEEQDVQQDINIAPAILGDVVVDVGVNGYVREEVDLGADLNEVQDDGEESS